MTVATVGTSVPQVTSLEKVIGRALYAGDIKLAGMLHAKVLRSPYAHARIVRIDTAQALALPGVKAVVTGEDTPARMWGTHRKEQRILAVGQVRFAGEEVAAVVAVDEDTARDALDLIHIEYEQLTPVLDPELALAAGAQEVHGGTGNLAEEIRIERGNVDAAFGGAAYVHEATYDVHSQYPGYMEPMGTVAQLDANDRLTVHTSTQSVHLARARLAEALDRPLSSIRVIQAVTGGGFGAKIVEERNSLITAFLATRVDRPVRLVNNRLEDFLGACSSVPAKIWLKMGLSADGEVVAKDVRITAECGAYLGLAGDVMLVTAMRSDNMQRIQNVRTHARLAYTHKIPRGAFRGFGGQQMSFALNSHMSVLADMIGMDPIDLHLRNCVRTGDTSVHGWKIGSGGLPECLEQVRSAMDWDRKRAAPKISGVLRRGIGMAAAMHVSGNRTMGNWDGTTIVLKVNEDGRAFVMSGECDIGQGSTTMLSQICADTLGVPLSWVTVNTPDTDTSPYALGSLASRVTINAGNAMLRAAQQAREQILEAAAQKRGISAGLLDLLHGVIVARDGSEAGVTLAEACRFHIFRHQGEGILVRATYDPPTQVMDAEHRGNIAPAYSFAAQAVEVEVDTETGKVVVVQTYVSDDCGRAINPLAVHGQTNGATVQAFGWALFEELQFENGYLMNGNFADYNMPLTISVPNLQSGIVESMDPNGPLGAKGASETAILPGAPAIANAVFDAIGVRITHLPITPEKILAGLQALKVQEVDHA